MNIHFPLMTLAFGGRGTSVHVPFAWSGAASGGVVGEDDGDELGGAGAEEVTAGATEHDVHPCPGVTDAVAVCGSGDGVGDAGAGVGDAVGVPISGGTVGAEVRAWLVGVVGRRGREVRA